MIIECWFVVLRIDQGRSYVDKNFQIIVSSKELNHTQEMEV